MKRLACIASLSVISLLVFAAVAVAQSSSNQSGSDQTQGSNSSQQADPNQIAWIHIHNQAFDPAQLNVAPGTEVAWVNDDTQPHSVTSEDGKLLDSGAIDPGKTYGVILDGSGTVTYHGDSQSMAGSIVVGGASGDEGSTPASGDATIPASDTTTPASDTTKQPAEETQPAEASETTEETQTSGS